MVRSSRGGGSFRLENNARFLNRGDPKTNYQRGEIGRSIKFLISLMKNGAPGRMKLRTRMSLFARIIL